MNNEKMNQIIDDAYQNFKKTYESIDGEIIIPPYDYINDDGELLSQEEFINKCKTDSEFSKTWELKIEEKKYTLDNGKVIKEINVDHVPKKSIEYIETKFIILPTGNIEIYE